MKALGKKYGQDAVITQTKGGGGATLKRTRKGGLPKRNIPIGKMRPGRTGEMDTRIKGKNLPMNKKSYDDSNWREEYKSYTSNKRYIELLENGPKSLSQSWLLGALYNEWKKIKGYNQLDPKENEGQLQSSLKEFLNHQKDQGI